MKDKYNATGWAIDVREKGDIIFMLVFFGLVLIILILLVQGTR